ncbi:MAG: dihydropteroate synthase [Alphaproteobacteria bacterium]|nr:MAG: dihydropteroate synthase [Alphaproteobacteria bacterium]
MHGAADNNIYIQPLGILRGCVASEAVKAGQARWLAGGPLAFSMVKVIFRQGAVRYGEALVPLCRLDNYVSDMISSQQEDISVLLQNISDVRSPRGALEWRQPLLQGIVNVTPDSFSDGGRYMRRDLAISHARRLIEAGADFIDIGGESTRPGATKVTLDEELDRVIPVITGLSDIRVPISIDTRNRQVMECALEAGATLINDVSALSHDSRSLDYVAGVDCPVILMHARNDPGNMQDNPCYDDVLLDVYDYLKKRLEICRNAGIARARIIIDPGIGFGKTVDHNMELMANLSLFHGLGVPLLLGVSRKSFIGHITAEKNPDERLAGSLAFGQMGYDQGVQILRVHDIRESRQARDIWLAPGN